MSDDIQIILPKGADLANALDHGLVALTEAISQVTGQEGNFGLGGRFGYGEDYENDAFLMRRYCWCERDDCRWCSDDACGCANPDLEYYVDGVRVSGSEHWAEARRILDGRMPSKLAEYGTPEYEKACANWDALVDERDRRLSIIMPERKHTCLPKGLMMDRARWARTPQTAPNFWHKKSGLHVWWYKWIGRDMEVLGGESVSLHDIFNDCLKSLSST